MRPIRPPEPPSTGDVEGGLQHHRRPRAFLPTALLLSLIGGVLALYSLDSSAGLNPLELPGQDARAFVALAPQGWDFFTKNPQDERVHLLRREGGEWVEADLPASADPGFAFGFIREARAWSVEIGFLMQELPRAEDWESCSETPRNCAETTGLRRSIDNPFDEPLVCGELVLVRQRPVPWAWSDVSPPVQMPSKIARVEVRC